MFTTYIIPFYSKENGIGRRSFHLEKWNRENFIDLNLIEGINNP